MWLSVLVGGLWWQTKMVIGQFGHKESGHENPELVPKYIFIHILYI